MARKKKNDVQEENNSEVLENTNEETASEAVENSETLDSEQTDEEFKLEGSKEETLEEKENYATNLEDENLDFEEDKSDLDETVSKIEKIDPKYLDKKGNILSEKKIAKMKAKEAKEAQKRKQAELEKKIINANKAEAQKKAMQDEEERNKERDALKAHKKAIQLARKRQTNMQYVDRFEPNPEDGLTDEQVNQRILEGFSNFKPKSSSKTVFQIVISNVFTVLNLLIFVIAGFLISIGSIKDLTFLLIISANIIIGIVQEIRAKKMIDKLSLISAPTVNVLRNGKIAEISTGEVVLDDIMILEAGKQICTDSTVVSDSIEVNESLLTGESDSILKKPGDILYSGSYVVSGSCKAKVEKVGKDNYIESLTTSAKKYVKPKSELLRSLNIIIYVMATIIIFLGVGLFYIQYVKNGMTYYDSVRKTAGAMVGMIPSGLYLCTSMALAVGVMRLGKKNVLVQELYCIEMLARINVLCLDKTGTITDGSMVVKDVVEYKNFGGINTKYAISAILNSQNDRNLTSQALENYFGLSKRLKCIGTIPFSSKRKYSASTFDKYGTYIMGAPEFILTPDDFKKINKDVDKFAKQGYRVLLLGYTEGVIANNEMPDTKVEPMSLILIEDNIRPDAIDTIRYFKESGVEVKVISGDNPATVGMIAKRAGIENADNYISLDGMSEQDVVRAAGKYTVFGRVSPSQKRLLVKTLKELGKTVAMTGDGVNDILALKEADCSIAMASGSEAARNVSHLVLLDSNFGSMPSVVAEGRRVINNITKVARLYLTKTMFSLLLAIIALIQGYYPISTNQLFMIDLLCIGIPSVILVLERNNELNKGHFLANVLKSALPGAIVIVIQSLIVFMLQAEFSMTQITSSTVIVITATFTCMMVLFDVCRKPFTNVHKILFYSMFTLFIFLSLVTPKFFDFSPLMSVGTYYSSTVEVVDWDTPTVGITPQDSVYVIDGYVLTKKNPTSNDDKYYKAQIQTSTHTVSVNDDGKILIDNTTLIAAEDYSPEILELYQTYDGYYGLGGYETSITYDSSVVPTVTENGDIYYNDTNTGYNVLPTVSINDSGYYVINSKYITSVKGTSVGSVTLDSNFNVYVNGTYIYNLYSSGFMYGSDSSNNLVLDMSKTTITFVDYSSTVTIKGTNYYVDGVDTGVTYSPEITVTEADYYIINGYLTNYSCNGTRDIRAISYTEVNGVYYLTVNGTTLDYEVTVYVTYGGNVASLPTNCLILLFMLCLLTMPLMNIVINFVPFVKKWVGIILDRVNKL